MGIPHGTPSGYSFHKCRCDICVTAKRERDRDYYRKNADARKAKSREYYRDHVVEQRAAHADYRERYDAQIKAAKKRYYDANRESIIAKTAAWQQANPDRVRAASARHREKYRAERRAASLARYHRLMAEDPERIRAIRRAWAKTAKGVLANRAARTKRRGAAYTPEALSWIASLVDPLCIYCGRFATEIDHLTPISRGGTGDVTNLAPCCRRCNARKGNQTREEFLARKEQ